MEDKAADSLIAPRTAKRANSCLTHDCQHQIPALERIADHWADGKPPSIIEEARLCSQESIQALANDVLEGGRSHDLRG
jgi:hypothetical protein